MTPDFTPDIWTNQGTLAKAPHGYSTVADTYPMWNPAYLLVISASSAYISCIIWPCLH